MSDLASRFGRGLRQLTPLATVVVAALVDLLPTTGFGPGAVAPAMLPIAAYSWSLQRPDLVSALDLFLVGLVVDLLGGTAPGATALQLLLLRWAVSAPQRQALTASPAAAWLGFAAALLLAKAALWLVMAAVHASLFPPGPLLGEILFTILFYRPVASLLGWLAQPARDADAPRR